MRITESQLRRIIREELMSSIERDKKNLIVQDCELGELDGYGIDRPAIPGGEGSHGVDADPGMVYEKGDDDFQQIRLARLKAGGVPPERAEKLAGSKLKHRGKRPGHG